MNSPFHSQKSGCRKGLFKVFNGEVTQVRDPGFHIAHFMSKPCPVQSVLIILGLGLAILHLIGVAFFFFFFFFSAPMQLRATGEVRVWWLRRAHRPTDQYNNATIENHLI